MFFCFYSGRKRYGDLSLRKEAGGNARDSVKRQRAVGRAPIRNHKMKRGKLPLPRSNLILKSECNNRKQHHQHLLQRGRRGGLRVAS